MPTVLRRLAAAAGFAAMLTACNDDGKRDAAPAPDATAAPDPAPEAPVAGKPRTGEKIAVEGVLRHFPQDVRSVEAWLGHEFVVGGTPIRPTEAVPAETLRALAGKTVAIEGSWNPGEEWKPTPEDLLLPAPQLPEGEPVIRGSGIEATAAALQGE